MNQARNSVDFSEEELERIKKRLSPQPGSTPMQGYLFKRSENLRIWNQRWFTLDPSTAKLEYRTQRTDRTPRGQILFDFDSTITVSPINFTGSQQYEGCCFYIGSHRLKHEYFLSAKTPAAAKAWVASLRAAAGVLRAHHQAVHSLQSDNQGDTAGTVAVATAIACATARDASKDIGDYPLQQSFRVSQAIDPPALDNLTIMKETLNVKDEELRSMAVDLRSKDSTIKELTVQLSEAANAAESAAESARRIEHQKRAVKEAADKAQALYEAKLSNLSAKLESVEESGRKVAFDLQQAMAEIERLKDVIKASSEEVNRKTRQLTEAEERTVGLQQKLDEFKVKVVNADLTNSSEVGSLIDLDSK